MNEYELTDCTVADDTCGGEVWYGPSSTGASHYVMCEAHRQERIERTYAIRQEFPDSAMAPSWFDPTYAGERWDSDY